LNNKDKNLNFIFNLNANERLELEIIVLDKDKKAALNFARKHSISFNETESLKYCIEWLKKIKKGEDEKLKIKFSDKGPRINI
jgi:hypothetical protein